MLDCIVATVETIVLMMGGYKDAWYLVVRHDEEPLTSEIVMELIAWPHDGDCPFLNLSISILHSVIEHNAKLTSLQVSLFHCLEYNCPQPM